MILQRISIVGLGVVLALVGTGCGTAASITAAANTAANTAALYGGTAGGANPSAGDAYNMAVDIPVPDTARSANDITQSLVEGVFGKVKVAAILSMSDQNFAAQYQTSRVATGNDVTALSNAFQAKGYTITSVSAADGQGAILATKGSDMVSLEFPIGGSKVSASVFSSGGSY